MAIAAVLILALLAGVIWILYRGAAEEPAPGVAEASQIRSLAVLPLRNLSGDPEQEYFLDGITEEIVRALEVKLVTQTAMPTLPQS